MAEAHDILGSMGVVVPHKIVKLSKPPSAFIAEGGGPLAAWQEAKLQQRAGTPTSASAGSAARTGKRMHASIARSERSSSIARSSVTRSSDADAAPAGGGGGAEWRAHAHPMQRSHFSTAHPSSLTLDSDTAPVSLNAKELANHRRVSNKAPAPPSPPHPLEVHHYGNAHATRREPLAPVNCNSSAAGAPSGKVKRQPIPSDVDSIKQKPVEYAQPVAQRVGAPKIWLEERDRKERLREQQQQQQQQAVVGRERVLSRGSPARERVAAEAGAGETAAAGHAPVGHHQAAARLWTAQRQKRDDEAPALARPLVHMHKKLWEPEVACSPRRTGEVGVQKSALQRQWGEQGWWSADAASPRSRVEVKPEYQAPSASAEPQPSFGVPNYARAGYEEIQRGTTHRRSPSPSATLRTASKPPLYRQWKP